jgi:hypothetical protein
MMSTLVRGRALFAVIGMCAFSGAAAAEDVVSCRNFAEAAADGWANGRIAKADNSTQSQPDEIVLISAGHKYIMPRIALNRDDVTLQPLGELANDRQAVYDEELRRCLHTRELNIYVNR